MNFLSELPRPQLCGTSSKYDVVFVSLPSDAKILKYAIEKIKQYAKNNANLYVVSRKEAESHFRKLIQCNFIFVDEKELLPEISLNELRQLPLPYFPNTAGWYYQQFLKIQAGLSLTQNSNCLIWDADTVLLQDLDFFNSAGTAFFTKAEEFHKPYFDTFERLFGFPAKRDFSFISQHIMLQRDILNEMIDAIHRQNSAAKHWAWKIMDAAGITGVNLFSEYETYGHYMKATHPERMSFRELNWTRNGANAWGGGLSERNLKRLGRHYVFAAFEMKHCGLRGLARFAKLHAMRILNPKNRI